MNNQSFRKLVHQHASINGISTLGGGKKNRGDQSAFKSSKEIARDAVEQEFNEIKRKRKKDSGFDGDFNDSDDDDDCYNRNIWKDGKSDKDVDDENNNKGQNDRRKRKRNDNQKNDDNGPSKNKYRDRAKERREGRNVDYQAIEGMYLPQDGDDKVKEMSKYLGGDETYTHLVKGLDKSLADKIRTEVRGPKGKEKPDADIDNIDLDEVMQEARALKAKEKDKSENTNSISFIIREKKASKIPFVSNMARYIERVQTKASKEDASPINVPIKNASSTAVQSLHRSMLTFSLKQNHHDLRQYGWELPKVSIAAINGRSSDDGSIVPPSCTPLDENLILKIKSVFNASYESKRRRNLPKQESRGPRLKDNNSYLDQKSNNQLESKEMDDSDDDIYGDIGDYI